MGERSTPIDVLIFGGGVAGMWLLDELLRQNCRALLLENHSLGRGQTVGSQGIIHGGLKYMFSGQLTPATSSPCGAWATSWSRDRPGRPVQ